MDAKAENELYLIKRELQSIINELDSIANGMRRDFSNIGEDQAAACVSNVAGKYRNAKRKLDNIDRGRVTDEFAAAHGGGGGGGRSF